MSKTAVEYTSRRVTYETPLPFDEVVARLDTEINKPKGPEIITILRTSNSKAEIEERVTALTGGRDFAYFGDLMYHRWLNAYTASTDIPKTHVYMLGSPLIAQGMLRYDLVSGLHLPPKVFVSEKADGSGTRIIYDDPEVVIPVPGSAGGSVSPEVKLAAEGLSRKLERLMETITRV